MSSSAKSGSTAQQDAIALLSDDHKRVKKLFKDFEKAKDGDTEEKVALVQQICNELHVHTSIEEEIFYPAVRNAIDDDDLMNEAEVEHDSAKDLIGQIESMEAEDPMYDAKVTVLGEYVNHHVEEEEKEMFSKAKKAKVDLASLGEEMLSRKEALMSTMDADLSTTRSKTTTKKKPKQSS